MELITSTQNSKIKYIRSLKKKKYRDASQEYLIEGIHHLGTALESNVEISTICYSPDLLRSDYGKKLIVIGKNRKISMLPTTEDIFRTLTTKENPAGILGVAKQNLSELSSLDQTNNAWMVALHSPQDPGNLGSILRTIDAVGANGIIMIGKSVDLHHPSIIRASMGAFFNIPIYKTSEEGFWEITREMKYFVVGTSANQGDNYLKIQKQSPKLILMGSEQKGLSAENLVNCHQIVSLPMQGKSTSLNLAVATGVLLYAMR
jgi:RNA methyltransferase, TrmH family